MKKFVGIIVVVSLFLIPFVLFAGGKKEAKAVSEKPRVVCYINGNLGDLGFWDSAGRGMNMVLAELPVEGRLIEGGYDPANWESDVSELANQNWDLIILGTWQMVEIMEKIAPKHPDKRFILFDAAVEYSKADLSNVYCMVYKNNEEAFLPGALAAMVTNSDMPRSNPDKVVAFNGNMDIPVLRDFLAGFEHGVRIIDPEVRVLVAWAGGFGDVAKTNENAMALADQRADVIYNASTGAGLIDVVREKKIYAIGVGSDIALMFQDKDPVNAKHIIASDLKNVDKTIVRAVSLYLEGNLLFGTTESLGIKEDGVGIAKNDIYREVVPAEFREKIDELERKVIDGEIKVDSVY